MNFRDYYEKQELVEFSDASRDGVVGKIASAAGDLTGSIYKGIAGYFKKAWDALPMAQTLKDMAEKGDKAIEVAKIIYPYPQEMKKYDQLKKEGKLKDSKMIASFFAHDKLQGEQITPLGLVIVYRTYDAVKQQVTKALSPQKVNVSMQSLLEAAKKEKIRFPYLKDLEELKDEFAKKEKKEGSQWQRWISTASTFSVWKHKYDKKDTEDETSFVSSVLDELNASIPSINRNIAEIEARGEEVNIVTLKDSFGKEQKEIISGTLTKIKEGTDTLINGSKIEVDESQLEAFLNSKLIKELKGNSEEFYIFLANIFISTYLLLQKTESNATITSVYSGKILFHNIFSKAKNFKEGLIERAITPLMQSFFTMNKKGLGDKKILMEEKYIKNPPNELYDLISLKPKGDIVAPVEDKVDSEKGKV